MAKQPSQLTQYIFPTILLLFGMVLLILWLKARKQLKKAEEMGLAGNTGTGYRILSEAELKKLTTITV